MKKLLVAALFMLSLNTAIAQPLSANKQTTYNSIIEFQGHIGVGTIFQENAGGPTLEVSAGARIADALYVGMTTGYSALFTRYKEYGIKYKIDEGYFPVGLNLKWYFANGTRGQLYVEYTSGLFFGSLSLRDYIKVGNMFQFGLGLDINRFNFGIGYSGLYKEGTSSSGYIKLGYRF